MIYEQAKAEYSRLTTQLKEIDEKLLTLPKEKLVITHSAPYCKWYCSDGKSKHYIAKSDRALAEQLAIKKYLSALREEILHEKRALEFYLKHHSSERQSMEMLQGSCPELTQLLAPHFKSTSAVLAEWEAASYEHNPKNPEHLIYRTGNGICVRSKSEALIATLLSANRIPFRYESPLLLGNVLCYPDFTIRHPQTGNFFYWEHFGMMGNDAYCKQATSKLQLYCANGIIPSINLLITYETKEQPLDTGLVQDMIKHYFLP